MAGTAALTRVGARARQLARAWSRPRRTVVVSACCAAVLLALAVAPLSATASRDEVEAEQDRVADQLGISREELAELSQDLVAQSARLAELEASLVTAKEDEEAAEADAEAARVRHEEVTAELVEAQAVAEVAAQRFEALSAEAAETERIVGGVARQVYQGHRFSTLSFIVEAQDPDEYTDMVVLASAAQRSQEAALAELQVQRADSRNASARLDAERQRVSELEDQAAAEVERQAAAAEAANEARARQESLVAEQVEVVAAVEAAKAAEEREIAELEAQSSELEEQLAQIAAEERRAAEEAARRAAEEAAANGGSDSGGGSAPAPSTAQKEGFLSVPAEGRLSSGFGYRIHPILNTRKLHGGTDFAAPCGTPVRAAADGTVFAASYSGSYGNRIVLTHGQVAGTSLSTLYAHLESFAVSGGSVSRGQVIGYIGTTGRSTGCHLHFETREDGTRVDPMGWL